ncbi:hypothetical protein CDAR_168571 [Caerostris darwini]|uniref:Uncharacterized protein n=1 Tax=Caerostris darwini TaxID=1538125 RepID=A0AAV4T3Y4_9ARAC|nr:hypothetical protein CDAR_168571 [Caerostris darwini]
MLKPPLFPFHKKTGQHFCHLDMKLLAVWLPAIDQGIIPNPELPRAMLSTPLVWRAFGRSLGGKGKQKAAPGVCGQQSLDGEEGARTYRSTSVSVNRVCFLSQGGARGRARSAVATLEKNERNTESKKPFRLASPANCVASMAHKGLHNFMDKLSIFHQGKPLCSGQPPYDGVDPLRNKCPQYRQSLLMDGWPELFPIPKSQSKQDNSPAFAVVPFFQDSVIRKKRVGGATHWPVTS